MGLADPGGFMSFALYIIGFIVLIAGLAIGANLMHIEPRWIGVGVVVLIGLGIVLGVTSTRQRDPSN
jgi:predicted signal transduction protein with EAL and GGDEF domain